ncbi:MAG: Arylsulfatase precursor [Verrucomicrobiota bacterium]|jgi:arylsulfatase A-like enzyme
MKKHILTLALLLAPAVLHAAENKPNILVILLDDMGYGQPGCYGGKLAPTPQIDSLGASGVRFTNGYVSACVCSPSRVGIMTGRYQAHSGHDGLTDKPGTELVLTETTIAQRMKSVGYTTGIVGKWHLGATSRQYLPCARGFDFSFGSIGNVGEHLGDNRFYDDGDLRESIPGEPITSPVYARKACEFIEQQKEKSWFLYLPFNAVHSPVVASDSALAKFSNLPKPQQAYAAMISEVDDAIGLVLAKLRELKLDENTLIVLTSDNGGAGAIADEGGLRGHKWLVYEGGIREPWIVSWKGHIPPGRVVAEPVIQLDILPTALAAAGSSVKPEWQLDGTNLLPLLEGKIDQLAPRELYFRFGVQYAVRQGDWKLVKASKDMEPMLVNLAADPGEQKDLSTENPEKKQTLQKLFDQWNATMQPPRWEDLRWNGEDERKQKKKKVK